MTYADKGMNLFSMMNDMSDALILESDIRNAAAIKSKRERTGRFSAFMNHPAMVAVLCAVVSLGVVVAMLVAGWNAPPAGNPTDNAYLVYEPEGAVGTRCRVTPIPFFSWGGDGTYAADGAGFMMTAEGVRELPLIKNVCDFELHLAGKRELRTVTVYHAGTGKRDMKNANAYDERLTPGLYFVALAVVSRDGQGSSCYEYAFALELNEAVDGLRFQVILDQIGEPVLPEADFYERVLYATDYTLTADRTVWSVYEDCIELTVTSNEPGKTMGGLQEFYKICRVKDGMEEHVFFFSRGGGDFRAFSPETSDSSVKMTVRCNLGDVQRALARENKTLEVGTYRLYYRIHAEAHEQYVEIDLAEIPGGEVTCTAYVPVLAVFSHGICTYVEGKGNTFISYKGADETFVVGDTLYLACKDVGFFPTYMTVQDESLKEPFVYEWVVTSYVVLRSESSSSETYE
ncbi:MAG: hypothetical protein IKW68_02555 [Clostridia bacterium]|nr:hypothetical protein [Clostridia bacterium]